MTGLFIPSKKCRASQAAILASVLLGPAANAQDDLLYDLSLEDLMQVRVISKKVESISQTPGTVSTYYPDQLRELGLHSFEEILSFAAGVEVNRSIRGDTPVQINGLADTHNQKVLFLINGVPYWMSSFGDIPLKGAPIAAIEKIEIVRGPASVLYGSNSSAGVISVVTKEPGENIDSLSGRSNGSQNLQLVRNKTEGNFTGTFSLEINNDDGYETTAKNTFGLFDISTFQFPVIEEAKALNQENYYSALATIQYKNWDLMLQRYTREDTAYSGSSLHSQVSDTQTGELVSLNYKKEIQKNELQFYTDWNRFYFNRDIDDIFISFAEGDGGTAFTEDGKNNYRWRSGVSTQFEISNSSKLLAGIVYESRQSSEYRYYDGNNGGTFNYLNDTIPIFDFEVQPEGHVLLVEENKTEESALYAQLDKTIGKLRAIVGARYVNNSFAGTNVSPKLSFVYSLGEKEALKLLFGEGYNAPTARQSSGRDLFGRRINDVEIDAEIVRTTELAYSKTTPNFYHSVTAFYTEARDLIEFEGASFFSEPQIVNSPYTLYRTGLEYEFNSQFKNTVLLGNITYLDQGNRVIENDPSAEFASKILSRLGVRQQFGSHALGTSLKYASERKYVDGQYLLNIAYTYKYKKTSLTATIVNALNETIEQPDVGARGTTILQTEDDLHFHIGIRWQL